MRRILVSCIGFNPANAIIAARHYGVSRASLLGTRDTRTQMAAVADQIGGSVQCIAFESAEVTIDSVCKRVAEALAPQPDETIVLDLTGATKLLCIGTWNAVSALPQSQWEAVYLEPGGEMLEPVYGERITHNVTVEISEVLAWQGKAVQKAGWQGTLLDVDQGINERASLGRFLLNAFADNAVRFHQRTNTATIDDDRPVPNLPPAFHRKGHKIAISHNGPSHYFAHNGWLEELCLSRARRVFKKADDIRAAAGLEVTIPGTNAVDEADVVMVRGPRTCVIEAKARRKGAGAGADLQKRIAKTRDYFGNHASVIFVHPAWGKTPPSELVARHKRDAILVGTNLGALDKAVFNALRFERDG